MNILYVASDVSYPLPNGGSRRAFSTAKMFSDKGHNAVILVNRHNNLPKYEETHDIKVYREKLWEIGPFARKLLAAVPPKVKKIFFSRFQNQKDGDEKDKNAENSFNYESHLSKTIKTDLKSKLIDLYRHKLPLHKYCKFLPAIPIIVKILKQEKIDLIIERGCSYGLGAWIAKLKGIPYIVDFIDINYSNIVLSKFADVILSYFTTFQIPSFVPRNKIKRVYTVTDTNQFRPLPKDKEILKKWGLSNNDFICIYIGGMFQWHGLDTMVETAKICKEKGKKNIKFLLVGDGLVRNDIIKQVKTHNLEDCVILPGRVSFSEVVSYLGCADVALSLNTQDSIGFKLLEYMAAGLPIITTNADVVELLIKDQEEGLHVNLNDPKDTYDKILQLYNDPKKCEQLGNLVREKAVKNYTWDAHYKNIMSSLLEYIKNKK